MSKELDRLLDSREQDAVMANYKRLDFVKDARDEEGLHMSFSPNVVPKGLTKLQVRRRVNKYFATKATKNPFEQLRAALGHRITIYMDGRFFSGITVASDVTKTPRAWKAFVKEYLAILSAPRKPMPKGF